MGRGYLIKATIVLSKLAFVTIEISEDSEIVNDLLKIGENLIVHKRFVKKL